MISDRQVARVLFLMGSNGFAPTQATLGKALGVSQSVVSDRIGELVNRGVISKVRRQNVRETRFRRDPFNGRFTNVVLSAGL